MKIPETTANVGAYYGNEENGQWQPNGVIIDSGVGGGVVGSGDAGIHRPPVYPLHIPSGHVPPPAGYVMAGAYYPPAAYPPPVPPAPAQDDFEDYMWMENEEEFDKQVMQQLEEEALMEQCIEAMLEDEQRERQSRPVANGHNNHFPTTSNGNPSLSLEEAVSRSTLNPLAAEFVPTRVRQPPPTDEKQDPPEAPSTEEPQQQKSTEDAPAAEVHTAAADSTTETPEQNTKEVPSLPKDTPEVSAADVQPIADNSQEKRPRDKKDTKPHPAKVEAKKPAKTELKAKSKPQPVKSETKIQPKKKELKTVKSEVKVEEKVKVEVEDAVAPVVETSEPQPAPAETTQAPSGFKPINYAAAAKANKPKKPSPPPSDKPAPPKAEKPRADKPEKKEAAKAAVQRKNSAK